jgi:hypothetical protein
MARRLFSTARRFLTLMGIFSHVAAGGCKARAVFRPRRLLIPPVSTPDRKYISAPK